MCPARWREIDGTEKEMSHRPEIYHTIADLIDRMAREGFRSAIVSVEHLKELREEIEGHHRAGRIADQVYRVDLAGLVYDPPPEMPEAKSVIIVSTPQPHIRFTFTWNGGKVETYLPPTYSSAISTRVGKLLAEILAPAGYRLVRARIPLKLAAVRGGLAQYGKNNITYVEGMGSYHRFTAFFSDLPCREDTWGEANVMEHCDGCTACRDKCPTGAIPSDRFLLRAERCLTYVNEHEGDFPAWLDPAAHHCLEGCLYCQSYCPVNRQIPLAIEDGPAFDDRETELILQGASKDRLPEAMIQKLEEFGFENGLPEIARNLRALLDRPQNLLTAPRLLRQKTT